MAVHVLLIPKIKKKNSLAKRCKRKEALHKFQKESNLKIKEFKFNIFIIFITEKKRNKENSLTYQKNTGNEVDIIILIIKIYFILIFNNK